MSQKLPPALLIGPLTTEGLSLVPQFENDQLVVRLKGNADSATNDAFSSFLVKLHVEAQRLEVTKLAINLTELYFMTSSCIKCFVTWIASIRDAPLNKQYSVNFVVNPNLRWQKRNLDVLLQLSPELLSLSEATG